MSQTIGKIPERIKASLKEVTRLQILELRLKPKKFVIVACNGKFYVYSGEKSNIIEIRNAFGRHQCSECANFYNEETKRLCPKVADASPEVCRLYTHSDMDALIESKRIEKYPFIEEGVEYVSNSRDFFAVTKCSNFKANQSELGRLSDEEISRMWIDERREELKKEQSECNELLLKFGFNPQ